MGLVLVGRPKDGESCSERVRREGFCHDFSYSFTNFSTQWQRVLCGYITVIKLLDWSITFYHDISTHITHCYLVLKIDLMFVSFRSHVRCRRQAIVCCL